MVTMTTDLALRLDAGIDTTAGMERLDRWVAAANAAMKLVTPLVGTAFVPANYWPRVDPRASVEEKEAARQTAIANATAAVLQGITLGLDPITALQQIFLINNRPGMYAKMKVALLLAHGHDVWTEGEPTAKAVTVCGVRKGTDHVIKVTITWEDAVTAGWTKNETYTKTPKDMLYARAAGRVCDQVAPDLLMGVATAEDNADREPNRVTATVGDREPATPVTTAEILGEAGEPSGTKVPSAVHEAMDRVTPTAVKAARAKAQPAKAQPAPKGETRTARMYGLLTQIDRADPDLAKVYIAGVIGRQVEASADLTPDEIEQVITAAGKEYAELTTTPNPNNAPKGE
jgi:hypothetical protein